jgi:hypothetical protein
MRHVSPMMSFQASITGDVASAGLECAINNGHCGTAPAAHATWVRRDESNVIDSASYDASVRRGNC